MKPSSNIKDTVGMPVVSVPNSAKRSKNGSKVIVNVAITQARRPPYMSEIVPTSIPPIVPHDQLCEKRSMTNRLGLVPGIIPISYKIDIRLLVCGLKDCAR